MIKITIHDVVAKKQEYLDATSELILDRVNVLSAALNNLNGGAISFSNNQFVKVKVVTKKIIDLVDKQININLDQRQNYIDELTNYISNPNNLTQINVTGLIVLVNSLTANIHNGLNELLICDPEQLLRLNDDLLDNNSVNTENNKKVLKLAFDYEDYDEISDSVKKFFRSNNFVKHCPYCNDTEAFYRETPGGQPATIHYLDHFFGKADYPLLAFSMFNLIPCDNTCNSLNKLRNEFSDEFHLNPYITGFDNSMSFVPIIIGSKIEVLNIDIRVNVLFNTVRYKQLVGPNLQINEADKLGNINVFKLKTKYRDKSNKAEKVIKKLKKTYEGLGAINKYLNALTNLNRKKNYIKWYEDEIGTSFTSDGFNNEAFSKFNKDMHDYYFSIGSNPANSYIRELISGNFN